jgi:hypothetical protein
MKTAILLLSLGLLTGCGTYSSDGYTRVASVTIANSPTDVTGAVVVPGVVDNAWDYGHVSWYYFLALGNVAPNRYTRHVDLRADVPRSQGQTTDELRIMQTEKPVGLRTLPPKGLFLLRDGDKVLLGLDKPTVDRRTRVVIYLFPRANETH